MNRAEFDPYSADYKALVNDALSFSGLNVDYFTKVKAEYLKDLMGDVRAGTKLDVLDIGCGIGNYHPLLEPEVGSLTGIDVSEESIRIAASRNSGVAYHCFDGRDVPFSDASFDVAFAVCVFHHVPLEVRPALAADVKRVLRPGGIFVVFEHNPVNPLTMRVVNRCVFDKDAVLLKSAEAEGLLGGAGFADVKSRFILTIPSFNRATRRLDLAMGRLPLGAQYFSIGRA